MAEPGPRRRGSGGARQLATAATVATAAAPSAATGGFPHVLYNILEVEAPEVITWTSTGRAFGIQDMPRFRSQVLPTHFKHDKFSSFQRQLNLYGFRKIVRGKEAGGYMHKDFQRGRADLLPHVRRGHMPPCPPQYERKIYGSGGSSSGTAAFGARSASAAADSDDDSEPELQATARGAATTRQTSAAAEAAAAAAAATASAAAAAAAAEATTVVAAAADRAFGDDDDAMPVLNADGIAAAGLLRRLSVTKIDRLALAESDGDCDGGGSAAALRRGQHQGEEEPLDCEGARPVASVHRRHSCAGLPLKTLPQKRHSCEARLRHPDDMQLDAAAAAFNCALPFTAQQQQTHAWSAAAEVPTASSSAAEYAPAWFPTASAPMAVAPRQNTLAAFRAARPALPPPQQQQQRAAPPQQGGAQGVKTEGAQTQHEGYRHGAAAAAAGGSGGARAGSSSSGDSAGGGGSGGRRGSASAVAKVFGNPRFMHHLQAVAHELQQPLGQHPPHAEQGHRQAAPPPQQQQQRGDVSPRRCISGGMEDAGGTPMKRSSDSSGDGGSSGGGAAAMAGLALLSELCESAGAGDSGLGDSAAFRTQQSGHMSREASDSCSGGGGGSGGGGTDSAAVSRLPVRKRARANLLSRSSSDGGGGSGGSGSLVSVPARLHAQPHPDFAALTARLAEHARSGASGGLAGSSGGSSDGADSERCENRPVADATTPDLRKPTLEPMDESDDTAAANLSSGAAADGSSGGGSGSGAAAAPRRTSTHLRASVYVLLNALSSADGDATMAAAAAAPASPTFSSLSPQRQQQQQHAAARRNSLPGGSCSPQAEAVRRHSWGKGSLSPPATSGAASRSTSRYHSAMTCVTTAP